MKKAKPTIKSKFKRKIKRKKNPTEKDRKLYEELFLNNLPMGFIIKINERAKILNIIPTIVNEQSRVEYPILKFNFNRKLILPSDTKLIKISQILMEIIPFQIKTIDTRIGFQTTSFRQEQLRFVKEYLYSLNNKQIVSFAENLALKYMDIYHRISTV